MCFSLGWSITFIGASWSSMMVLFFFVICMIVWVFFFIITSFIFAISTFSFVPVWWSLSTWLWSLSASWTWGGWLSFLVVTVGSRLGASWSTSSSIFVASLFISWSASASTSTSTPTTTRTSISVPSTFSYSPIIV